jgi:hypothetical protein
MFDIPQVGNTIGNGRYVWSMEKLLTALLNEKERKKKRRV